MVSVRTIAVLALLACAPAHALDLELPDPVAAGLHVGSVHSRSDLCDFNPGAYARWANGFTAGAYRNSECNFSAYAAWTGQHQLARRLSVALTAGAVVGYERSWILPLVVPSVRFGLDARDQLGLRLGYIPKIEKDGVHTLTVMLERKL